MGVPVQSGTAPGRGGRLRWGMARQSDRTAEQQARLDRIIDEFRAARQRDLVKQGIALWDRTEEAYRNSVARVDPPPVKLN